MLPLNCVNTVRLTPKPATLSLTQDEVIPALHEKYIVCTVTESLQGKFDGLVESTPEIKDKLGILIATGIAECKDGQCFARVANIHSYPIKLYKNATIGTFEKLPSTGKATPMSTTSKEDHVCSVNTTKSDPLALILKSVETSITKDQQQKFSALLHEFEDIFSKNEWDIGRTHVYEHTIPMLPHAVPFKRCYNSMSRERRKVLQGKIDALLEADLIEPTHSEWAAPSLLVPKKDGSLRLVIDYRGLNKNVQKTSWPLPRIADVLDALEGNIYFTSIDLTSGYHQMPLAPHSRKYTAFVTPDGLYQWKRLPMGLSTAPGAFQNLMEIVMSGLSMEIAMVYLDDIVVFGRTFEEHLQRLRLVFVRLRDAGLKIKAKKCDFLKRKIKYLGHVISERGIATDPDKIAAVQRIAPPKKLKDLRAFLGIVGFYRKFIYNFGEIAMPLYNILNKDTKFLWSAECQCAFDALKQRLLEAPILGFPTATGTFVLTTDASLKGMGAILEQKQPDASVSVIAYASKSFNKAQQNYSATKRELYAVVYFTGYFKHYLLGQNFRIITDHRALVWLYSFKDPDGIVARWIEKLSQYSFTIEHKAGKGIPHADGLSRLTENTAVCALQTVNPLLTQLSDPDLQKCYQWLQQKSRPEKRELQGSSKKLWRLWGQFDSLELIDDHIYRRFIESANDSRLQLLVAAADIPQVLYMLHDNKTAGHLGMFKTYERVTERFYWPGMKNDIRDWVNSCVTCQKRLKPQQKHRHDLIPWKPSYPFHQVALDVLGPLPVSDGNKYILLMGDQFTKWYEAVAMPDQQAVTVAQAFISHWVVRFGCPERLHSDRGSNFTSKVFQAMATELQIERSLTTPYHPQGNAIIERTNRTLEDGLAKFVAKNQADWSKQLKYVLMAYRSSVHATTNYSPFYLVFGAAMRLPIDYMFPTETTKAFPTPSDYTLNLRSQMQKAYETVRHTMSREQERQRTYYGKKACGPEYAEGDEVMLFKNAVAKGDTKKLSYFYEGPMVIKKKVSDVTYIIEDKKSGKEHVTHYDRLKLFKQRTNPGVRTKKPPSKAKVPKKSKSLVTIDVDESPQTTAKETNLPTGTDHSSDTEVVELPAHASDSEAELHGTAEPSDSEPEIGASNNPHLNAQNDNSDNTRERRNVGLPRKFKDYVFF